MKWFLWIALLGWSLVSVWLHLSPIGEWVEPLRRIYDYDSATCQAVAHFVLNAGFSFILLNLLKRGLDGFPAFLWTMCIALAFAVSMEVLQGALPCTYRRTCDVLDLLPALGGALLGALSALGYIFLRKTLGKEAKEDG